jgi:hypothetical protein
MRLDLEGWSTVPVWLRVVDPPDLSAYAPDGGWSPGTAAPPYEGNDNRGVADYGLSSGTSGPWETSVKLKPGSDNMLRFYLKVPPQFAGDNFQVEVTKCRPDETVLPQRIVGLSSPYTSWKRVFVERDRMFRQGGLLFADFDPTTCSPDCDRIEVYDWQNTAVGETVVVFDKANTAERGGEQRTVTSIAPGSRTFTRFMTVSVPLTKRYLAAERLAPPADDTPDFHNFQSGGIGVLSGCDQAPNQINSSGSCFFDPDLRGVESPFGDAFVEVLARRDGDNATPYAGSGQVLALDLFTGLGYFSATWFSHFLPLGGAIPYDAQPHNYFHVLTGGDDSDDSSGYSRRECDYAYTMTGWILSRSPAIADAYSRASAVHELGHLFALNQCDSSNNHDPNLAWCNGQPGCTLHAPAERCVMYVNHGDPEWGNLIGNDINRFCCMNLFGPRVVTPPTSSCCEANQACTIDDGIRNHADPE